MLGSQRGPFGLLLAGVTVDRGPPPEVVEVGSPDANKEITVEEERGTLLLTVTEELLLAGAAVPKLANKTEQMTTEENLDML